MTFKNFSITAKLSLGFAVVLSIVFISACALVWQVSNLAEIQQANSQAYTVTNFVNQLSGDMADVRASAYKIVISGSALDLPTYKAARAEFDKDLAQVETILRKTGGLFLEQIQEVKATVVEPYLDHVIENQVKLALDPATRQAATASLATDATVRARKASLAKIAAFLSSVAKWADDHEKQAEQAMFQTKATVIVAGVLSLLLGTAMAWLISRAISRPMGLMTATMRNLAKGDNSVEVPARDQTDEIGQMAGAVQVFKEAAIEKQRLEAETADARRVAQVERERVEAEKAVAAKQQAQVVENIASGLNKLAAGDLLQRIDNPFAVEYEGLRRDFNAAVLQLQRTIKDVSVSSGTIQSGTTEISTASDDLSRRTEQQAANLEETAAALAEITEAMKRSAEGARHAREVVAVTQTTADRSSDVVGRTVDAMGRIDQASRQISNIIGVIDEIAFQTNLLALNAGVEAARAGESGRGFAVVASEVRGLAQRCAEAAKEVKTLVLSSEKQVKAGVELVTESGSMLSQIVGQIGQLRTIVNDITASAETQAAGISEVNIAITQLDQVTQQNAAMAEEATAAARNLSREGTELLRLVGQFSTGTPGPSAPLRVVGGTSAAPRQAASLSFKRKAAGAAPASAAEDWQEF